MDPKIRAAMELIEEAQYLMNAAAQALCSVKGMGDAYGQTCRLGDNIKAHWHEVDEYRMVLLAPEIRRRRQEGRARALKLL